jgi:hypothetical protein
MSVAHHSSLSLSLSKKGGDFDYLKGSGSDKTARFEQNQECKKFSNFQMQECLNSSRLIYKK